MKLLKAMGLAAAATLTLCADSYAQSALSLEFTPVAGGQFAASVLPRNFMPEGSTTYFQDSELANAIVGGAYLGIRYGDRWGIEANVLFAPTSMSGFVQTARREVDVVMMTYGVSASYGREVLPRFTPFVVAGAGAKRYDIDVADVSAQTDFMWNFGAGAMYALRPGLSLYLEARDFASTFKSNMSVEDEAQHDLVLAAGLRLSRSRGAVTVARR